jgi:hypothetical protein
MLSMYARHCITTISPRQKKVWVEPSGTGAYSITTAHLYYRAPLIPTYLKHWHSSYAARHQNHNSLHGLLVRLGV